MFEVLIRKASRVVLAIVLVACPIEVAEAVEAACPPAKKDEPTKRDEHDHQEQQTGLTVWDLALAGRAAGTTTAQPAVPFFQTTDGSEVAISAGRRQRANFAAIQAVGCTSPVTLAGVTVAGGWL